jgi:hypothetical protein
MKRLLMGLVAILIAVTGCASTKTRTFSKPTDVPALSALVPNGSRVPFGNWGVVTDSSSGISEVMALRIHSVVAGKAGEFKDMRISGLTFVQGDTVPDQEHATPYFISYDWVVVSGDSNATPNWHLDAHGDKGGDIDSLVVTGSAAKCDVKADADDVRPGPGYELHGCAVLLAEENITPISLDFTAHTGSKMIQFTLPTSDSA